MRSRMSSYFLKVEEVNEYDTLWIVDMQMLQFRLYSFLLPLSRLCCLQVNSKDVVKLYNDIHIQPWQSKSRGKRLRFFVILF